MTAIKDGLLIVGDYPVGFANGIGETLSNLLEGFPDQRLFQVHPSHFAARAGMARGQSATVELPHRPAWIPPALQLAYYPVLKLRQAAAERALFACASRVIEQHRIGAVLTYPVTPWVLFAAVRLRRRFPDLRFVFYVMDDWEGHHTCFGLPFTPRRRAALAEIVATSDIRFACSHVMQADYEARFGNRWQVLHKGVPPDTVIPVPVQPRQPWRILYAGGMNVFRADAVMAFVEGVARFRQASGHDVTLTLLGAAGDAPALAAYSFIKLEPWVDAETSRRRQAEADILYLPLSLLPHVSRIAELAMPTKFGEYLVTGRPLILHVPERSEVSLLARSAGLAPVISTLDPQVIYEHLQRLDASGIDAARHHAGVSELVRGEFDAAVLRARLMAACFGEAPQQ